MAAAYVDERSVRMFLAKVGSVYPAPLHGAKAKGRWSKFQLDLVARETVSDVGADLYDLI